MKNSHGIIGVRSRRLKSLYIQPNAGKHMQVHAIGGVTFITMSLYCIVLIQ